MKGEPVRNYGLVDMIQGEKGNKEVHPMAQGPSEAKYYIEKFTRPNDLVLDPFCGSGTTLVEAFKLRRRAIGIEINNAEYKRARKVISKLVSESEKGN